MYGNDATSHIPVGFKGGLFLDRLPCFLKSSFSALPSGVRSDDTSRFPGDAKDSFLSIN